MGHIDVAEEALTFLMSVCLGGVFCFLYDIVRALHKTTVNGFFEVLVLDLVFWAVLTLGTFSFLVLRCLGRVRLYVIIGELCGFTAVRLTLSKIIVNVFSAVFSLTVSLFGRFFDCLLKVTVGFEKKFKKNVQSSKKLLQHYTVLLYNQLKLRLKPKTLIINDKEN